MPINFSVPQATEFQPRLVVFGVGGGGGNAVNNMIAAELQGVEFVVANTDAQHLEKSACQRRIQLGANLTRGLGAGMKPDVGSAAATESEAEIAEYLQGFNMAFIAAGMGGGTGTGAAPVVARIAKSLGILTVGVVTKPFSFEGTARQKLAEAGIRELQQHVDALIVIPNQNLFRVATEKTSFVEALKLADNVLHLGVRGITDLIVNPGIVNLDFADVKSAMSDTGKAMMGTGEAEGERRAIEAAERAIANPLLDETSMKGARGLIINITGGPDLTLFEVDEAAQRVKQEVDADADIYIGTALDEAMAGRIRVSVVATGIDAQQNRMPAPAGQEKVVPMTRPVPQPAQPAPARGFFGTTYASAGSAAISVRAEPVMAPATAPQAALAQPVAEAMPVAAPVQVEMPVLAPQAELPMPAQRPVAEIPARPAPSTVDGEGRFIPGQTQPPRKPLAQRQAETGRQADPLEDAAHANGAPRKTNQLLNWIVRSSKPAAAPAERIEPAMPAAIRAPAAAEPAPVAAPAPAPAAAPTMFEAAESRPAAQPSESDLMDIPAFLRRQAN